MKEVAISEFKAKCLAVLKQVRLTKKPMLCTRQEFPITHEIMVAAGLLPRHQDPADRILAATAQVMDLVLVTADERPGGSERSRAWQTADSLLRSPCFSGTLL